MKKVLSKSISFVLSLIVALSVCAISSRKTTILSAQAIVENCTPTNHYSYRLSEVLDVSPDSFEAWIKVNKNSTSGGVIMGNKADWANGYPGCVNWEVTTDGYVKVYWDWGKLEYVFTAGGKVNNGEWRHVAVVRDKQAKTFSLYVDGEFKESVRNVQRDAISTLPMSIGVDYRSWTTSKYNMKKTPLDGAIRQVTLYNGAISSERVRQDMLDTAISTDDENATLIGNWYLGETWTGETVLDSGNGEIVAKLNTWEKYVSVPEGFFNTDSYDYMFIGIPDIQAMIHYRDLNDNRPNACENMANWIVANKDLLKIKFCVQVGDLSDNGMTEIYYETAARCMSILDDAGVPWSFVQGNHDYDYNCSSNGAREATLYNKHFPYSKYSQYPWFGGAYEEGNMANTYFKYDINGVKYLVLNLEFGPRRSVIRWAKRIADRHPDYRVIVNTHNYLDGNGVIDTSSSVYSACNYSWAVNTETTTGIQLYNGLISQCPNMFMTFNGHVISDDVKLNVQTGVFGNSIWSWMLNNQVVDVHGNSTSGISGIGEDPIMLFAVNETTKTIKCCWYSPSENAQFGLQNYFEINF